MEATFSPQQTEALGRLEAAMRVIDRNGHCRMTGRQATALLAVFTGEADKTPLLVGDVRELAGIGGQGLELFYAPDPIRNPRGLDLIYQESDRADRRKKYMRLTPKGIALTVEVKDALEGKQ